MNPETNPETLRDDELLMAHASLHSYFRELSLDRQVNGWDRESIISAHNEIVEELQDRNLNHKGTDKLDDKMIESIKQFAEDILSKNERSTGRETTNPTRESIIQELSKNENRTLSKTELEHRTSADPDEVEAALRGLTQEGVLERTIQLESEWYHLPSISQGQEAVDGTSAAELAQRAIKDSIVMGDPREGNPNDDFDRLMSHLLG